MLMPQKGCIGLTEAYLLSKPRFFFKNLFKFIDVSTVKMGNMNWFLQSVHVCV